MRVKIWLRRFLFRWTRKGRAIRQMGRELNVKESTAFEVVALIEAESINMARQVISEARREAWAKTIRSSSGCSIPERPRNQSTSGARLSS
jgi:hypothetical protein